MGNLVVTIIADQKFRIVSGVPTNVADIRKHSEFYLIGVSDLLLCLNSLPARYFPVWCNLVNWKTRHFAKRAQVCDICPVLNALKTKQVGAFLKLGGHNYLTETDHAVLRDRLGFGLLHLTDERCQPLAALAFRIVWVKKFWLTHFDL